MPSSVWAASSSGTPSSAKAAYLWGRINMRPPSLCPIADAYACRAAKVGAHHHAPAFLARANTRADRARYFATPE